MFNATGALWFLKSVSLSLRLSAVLIPSLYDKPNRTKPLLRDTEGRLTKGYFKINVSNSLSVVAFENWFQIFSFSTDKREAESSHVSYHKKSALTEL